MKWLSKNNNWYFIRGAPDIVSGRIVTKSYYPVSGRIFTIIRPDIYYYPAGYFFHEVY
jgi:hypothetical protein